MDSSPAEPPRPFKPRHTNAQRAILGLNIVVVIACLIGAGSLVYAKSQLDQRLQTTDLDVNTTLLGNTGPISPGDPNGPSTSAGPTGTFPAADPQAQNFLITGSDANACVDPNSPWAGAADPARENLGNRSDTIMVMRVDPTTSTAAVLSFPRDLWVKIPEKGKNRINAAYVKDDPTLLAQTLYDNFGIVVDHYIQVDFCAFKRIVDAVGGVTVPFETQIVDKNVGLDVPAGCHTFSGDEALAYVRSRHLKWVDEDGVAHEDRASDLGRISRQQDFLRRTLQAALDKGLFDPAVAKALIESLQTDIVTEKGFTVNDMLKFAGVLQVVDPAGIRTYQIEASRLIVSGNDVLEPKVKGENMLAILAIFQGTAPLAGAPDQVFATTTTATEDATGSSTVTTSTEPVTGDTVAGPDENVKGDILPPEDVQC